MQTMEKKNILFLFFLPFVIAVLSHCAEKHINSDHKFSH